jgi:hypothetical protein
MASGMKTIACGIAARFLGVKDTSIAADLREQRNGYGQRGHE